MTKDEIKREIMAELDELSDSALKDFLELLQNIKGKPSSALPDDEPVGKGVSGENR